MKTTYTEITKLLENIDVSLYAKNRNFIDGSVANFLLTFLEEFYLLKVFHYQKKH